jgi:hypothetical protein
MYVILGIIIIGNIWYIYIPKYLNVNWKVPTMLALDLGGDWHAMAQTNFFFENNMHENIVLLPNN